MKARIWTEHCARDEWGSGTMRVIAEKRFLADPSLDIVLVHEHGGWSLSWNRAGDCVSSANDAAKFPERVREWFRQFDGAEYVGECRRDDAIDQRYPNYFPALLAVA